MFQVECVAVGNDFRKKLQLTSRRIYMETDEEGEFMDDNGFLPTVLVESISRRWRIAINCYLTLTADCSCKDSFKKLMDKFGSTFQICYYLNMLEYQVVIDDLRNARGKCLEKIWLDDWKIDPPKETQSAAQRVRVKAMSQGNNLQIDTLIRILYKAYCM